MAGPTSVMSKRPPQPGLIDQQAHFVHDDLEGNVLSSLIEVVDHNFAANRSAGCLVVVFQLVDEFEGLIEGSIDGANDGLTPFLLLEVVESNRDLELEILGRVLRADQSQGYGVIRHFTECELVLPRELLVRLLPKAGEAQRTLLSL